MLRCITEGHAQAKARNMGYGFIVGIATVLGMIYLLVVLGLVQTA